MLIVLSSVFLLCFAAVFKNKVGASCSGWERSSGASNDAPAQRRAEDKAVVVIAARRDLAVKETHEDDAALETVVVAVWRHSPARAAADGSLQWRRRRAAADGGETRDT